MAAAGLLGTDLIGTGMIYEIEFSDALVKKRFLSPPNTFLSSFHWGREEIERRGPGDRRPYLQPAAKQMSGGNPPCANAAAAKTKSRSFLSRRQPSVYFIY